MFGSGLFLYSFSNMFDAVRFNGYVQPVEVINTLVYVPFLRKQKHARTGLTDEP